MTLLRWRHVAAALGGTAFLTAGCVMAGPPPAPPPAMAAADTSTLAPAGLDQLVAPVALYPDALLADILTASTYPLDVVEAQRWVSQPANAALRGDALAAALNGIDWDTGTKALVPFPAVLQMMDGHLDWTKRLGETFLAQQGDVMDAVQRLRARAQQAGTLKASPQQAVAETDGAIVIAPPPSQIVYVPTYDPWCAYGPWPYAPYGPYYFTPWSGACGGADLLIGFDAGLFLPFGYWNWGGFDWRNHGLRFHDGRFGHFGHGYGPGGGNWHHDPAQRGGVPYSNPRNAHQYQPDQAMRQPFRGYQARDGAAGAAFTHTAPAFENFNDGARARAESQRGQSSLRGMSGGFGGSGPRGGGASAGGGFRGGGGFSGGGGGHSGGGRH